MCLCLALPAGAEPTARLGKDDVKIHELISRGLYVEAAQLITRTTASALLVRGHLWLRANRVENALEAFDQIASAPEGLHDFLEMRRAQAFVMDENPTAALGALKSIKQPKLAGSLYDRLRARALRESGQIEEGRRSYQALLKRGHHGDVPVALLGLARLETEQNNLTATYEYLRRLDLEYPVHWARARAQGLINLLKSNSKAAAARWNTRTLAEQVAQAERMLKAHRNRSAINVLRPLTGENQWGQVEVSSALCSRPCAQKNP